MTKVRYPTGWTTRRSEGERPDLSGTWLDPSRAPTADSTLSHRRSYDYWLTIHWATPPWMARRHWEAVQVVYNQARAPFDHVDHIVPLKHPLVCGLNVPWNLRVTTRRENMSKSNNYWPDCPDHLCPQKNLPEDMFLTMPDLGPPHYQHQMQLVW